MDQERKHHGNPLADATDSDGRLRLIVSKTPALIYSACPDGYIDFFNQQCLEYLALPFEKISGWKWMKLLHPDDRKQVLAKWRSALQSGESFKVESRVRRDQVTFAVVGRIETNDLPELERLIKSNKRPVTLDLEGVTLVHREAVTFLANFETDNGRITNCPSYIREWIRSQGAERKEMRHDDGTHAND